MNTQGITVRCPGKINWVLRILGKRADRFHEVATVLQAIDVWDTLTIGDGETVTLSCDRPGIPTDDTNLVIRAARALAGRTGVPECGSRRGILACSPRAATLRTRVSGLDGGLGAGLGR